MVKSYTVLLIPPGALYTAGAPVLLRGPQFYNGGLNLPLKRGGGGVGQFNGGALYYVTPAPTAPNLFAVLVHL